jgi:hypothetical protein
MHASDKATDSDTRHGRIVHHHRPAAPGRDAPLPGLLGLQSTAGNAAVVQMLRQTGQPSTGGAPQVQRMDAVRKQFNAATSLFALRRDEAAPGAPRQQAVKHIRDLLKDKGLEGEDTVGARVADSIDGIKTVAGEHGSREIHRVFMDPKLAELYAIPNNDPRAPEAHKRIAAAELEYWNAEHRKDPSAGTKIATDVDLATRARLQQNVGGVTSHMRQMQAAFHKEMENR